MEPTDHRTLEDLPDEIDVATFARLAKCSVSIIRQQIREDKLPARTINPNSRRPTYRIRSSELARYGVARKRAPVETQRERKAVTSNRSLTVNETAERLHCH